MADVETAPSFGAELKARAQMDGFKPVNAWVTNGISWLDEIQAFYRERSAIEKEYSQKLSALARKYYEKKAKRSSSLSVGDTPTITPGSLESASMTTWGVQLSTLESRAGEHDRFANQLLSNLAEPLKVMGSKLEDLRRHHAEFAGKLEKERDGSYAELKKAKGRYDSVCQDVENKRKKQDGAFDHGRAKAAAAFNQQQDEMRNVKNTYLISINVTNKQKERYYNEYIPELLDSLESLQDLSETRVIKLNSIWLQAAAIEHQTLSQSTQLIDHLSSEIPRNQPHLDSLMFVRHNAADWAPPIDFAFEPSPVWLDDSEMAIDATSQIFLRNILTKSKSSLAELRQDVDAKRREVEGAKRVRGLIREGKDKRDEASVLQAQFQLQEMLHESERKKITAEVEVATIASVVGDISIGAKAHAFKAQTFKIPTNCDLCGERIWGLSAKGFDCKDCGFTCHSKCEMKVPADCPGEVDKAQMKKLKAERQVAAQSSQSQSPAAVTSNGDGANDGGRLTRRDTIGSMSTLSSGYAASAHRSVSGPVAGQENGDNKPAAKIGSSIAGSVRHRIVAPPPIQYTNDSPGGASDSDSPNEERGRMLYPYQKNGDGEVTVDEGDTVAVLEPDDGSGWTKIRAGHATGVVPTSYIEFLGPSPSRSGASTPAAAAPSPAKKKGPAVAPRRGGKKAAPAPEPEGRYVEALYTYAATAEGESDMTEGERLLVVAPDAGDGWIEVQRSGGEKGVVPAGWVRDV
ncbi:FCH-domain-containing protein [Myriangium duriaei CBS 260.36]|uniref:Protein BZZ1 n=1 Tax=Myriangium duriaei CBS 260.36 TaxID=1168546 RepID=A0A9P4J5V2_9PEZI|nr:FCH-domain-containing protein [Myriangium duriaei CBS 260.36]